MKMSKENLAMATFVVALIGTAVTCILAYKLNQVSSQVENVTTNPVGALTRALGG